MERWRSFITFEKGIRVPAYYVFVMSGLRVGMISRTIPPFDRGGIQTYVLGLSRALVDLGLDVHLFIIGEKIEMEGLKIHPVRAFPLPRLTAGLYMSFALNAARHVSRYDLDVIHGHSMYAGGYALSKNLPFVVTLHGTQLSELRSTFSTRPRPDHVLTDSCSMFMERAAAAKADIVIAVCKKHKREVVEQYGIDEEKLRVVYEGIDVDRFSPSSCEGNDVLFVGRLHQRKGVDRLLRAFKKVTESNGDARLRIAGKGEGESEYKKMARELGLGESVEFLGHVPDSELPALYSSASMFVMPSYYEGFGLVLLEAMASGLPVLAFDTGVAPEIIKNGKNGYIVDEHDMHDRILEMLSNPKKRKAMGKAGRKVVEKNLTWKKTAEHMLGIYREILE
jgi:glycosyltransferase involved in cell wall biosynthesis